MTTHVNSPGRPTLAPLWTGPQSLGQPPAAAFRAAQAPLLSPSPLSMRKKDRALLDSLSNKISPSSVSDLKPLASVEGISPLVSKLEHASIELTNNEKSPSKSPEPAQSSSGEAKKRRDSRLHEEYGNIKTADAFIIARSIRRDRNSTSKESLPFWEDGLSTANSPRRLTLRAIIRPKAPGRQSFLIQRSLDIDELRATTSTSNAEKGLSDVSPLKASRKPLPVPTKWSSNRKSQGIAILPSQARLSAKTTPRSNDYAKLIHDSKTVPIHTNQATSSLPALATLLNSGHIQTGDIVYLPVPHAESWTQTVRYVYTGQGELATAIRENIIYLGGRV
ncbi:hypothetical protein NPX13_g8497 [Xylaria arbuscula]|uniref:Uncharacterized protein n=1 Tax=Xylaria arbuscula TaxID=114810 RepID=A0A9W8N8G9_9PEZI|nr:hypothetical protein NPX13_g8497 [Xylaria arbuscula]